VLLLLGGLGFTEATGVTNVTGTVIRLFSPEGTLVVGVDDPGVRVKMDGSDLVITGTGVRELRLKPGRYTVEARKDGEVVSRELVSVTKDGRQVVRVSQEAVPPDVRAARAAADAAAWESSVAARPADEQANAVVARLKELNPDFDGQITPTIFEGVVTGLQFRTSEVVNIGPLRALKGLTGLNCGNTLQRRGKLSDLSPLQGMSLHHVDCTNTQVADLTALNGMPLTTFSCAFTPVSDLAPLKGMMSLEELRCHSTKVSDLSPLKGMRLSWLEVQGLPVTDLTPLRGMPLRGLDLYYTRGVTDLKPLQGMPLEYLNLVDTSVSDLSPLAGMTSLKTLIAESCRVSDLSPLKGLELETIRLTPKDITQGLGILRDMRSLKTIGIGHNQTWPAAEFWDRYDRGEFKS
jgi:Leucine-rich repeat (LRR) protein